MADILKTMTVHEAAPLWDDPRSVHLTRWGETFTIRLDEFHYGHIATYEQERLAENVSYPTVWAEVKALRALLQNVGLGEEIESHYTTSLDRVKLTAEERDGLTPRARAYVEYLEGEISQLRHESDKTKATLRKINWGRKR
jgi:Trp operon repressor